MSEPTRKQTSADIEATINEVLKFIEQEREREIITRRFGLFDRKETLEQIGELLGITRERVRQLEKAILIRLKLATESGKLPLISTAEKNIIRILSENGRVARVSQLAKSLIGDDASTLDISRVAFIAELSPQLASVNENDNYHHTIGVAEHADEKKIKENIDTIVKTIKTNGSPMTAEQLHDALSFEHPRHIEAYASASKNLSNLRDLWGLNKWPSVNPKNIRDKIFVILSENGKPLHFSDIAKAIKQSSFKRKDVTTQAIHNELIKDKRFVLIGRGIYALSSWGYSQGTVADIIADVLKKAAEPLKRDEIVKRVLESRQVKETTILLNLQSKPQFKRVAKATYVLAEDKS